MPEARVRGTALNHIREYVASRFGESAVDEISRALSSEAARAFGECLAFDWVPLTAAVEIEREIAKRYFGGDAAQISRLGEFDMEQSIGRVYRVMFRFLSVGFVVPKAPRLFNAVVDQGELIFDSIGRNHLSSRLVGLDPIDPVTCHYSRGCFAGALKVCGVSDPQVEHVSCVLAGAPACAFEARW